MSRDDVADSLPGVAISIALVPPLAVVGVSLSQGRWDEGWGAMLLFLTNFLSILLAGGGTLALLGLSNASTEDLKTHARRRAFTYIAIGTLLVAIPLGITSNRVARETTLMHRARLFTQAWLDQSTFELTEIDAHGNQVVITIRGPGEPPPLPDLGDDLRAAVDPTTQLKLEVVPSQQLLYPDSTPD
jgi:uncharacterized membrane protein